MEIKYRRLPSVSMFFALFCFFLPFLTLSCPGGSITLTGMEIATGSDAKKEELFGNTDKKREFPGEHLLPNTVVLTLIAALVGLAAGREPLIATGAIGALNFILLLSLKFRLDHQTATEGGGILQVTWGMGFWMALIAYAGAAAIVFMILKEPDPAAVPRPQE